MKQVHEFKKNRQLQLNTFPSNLLHKMVSENCWKYLPTSNSQTLSIYLGLAL